MVKNKLFALIVFITIIFIMDWYSCSKSTELQMEGVAKVGNSILSESELESLLPSVPFPLSDENKLETINNWVKNELLYQEALKLGLAKDLLLKKKVENYEKSVLSMAYLDIHLADKVSVTTEEIRNYYQDNRASFVRKSDNIKVVHFLLNSQKEAVEVKENLLSYKGTTRQKLLSKYNADIRMVSKGTILPELEKELFQNKRSSGVVGPIKTNRGFHVLEILGSYPAQSIRGVDEVFEEISQHLFRQKLVEATNHLIDSLITEYDVEITFRESHE